MIRAKHVNQDVSKLQEVIDNADVDEKNLLKVIAKGIVLLVKIVRDIRTNQVTIMRHQNITLKEDHNEHENIKEENEQ